MYILKKYHILVGICVYGIVLLSLYSIASSAPRTSRHLRGQARSATKEVELKFPATQNYYVP